MKNTFHMDLFRSLVQSEATKGVQKALIPLEKLRSFLKEVKVQPLSQVLVEECETQVSQLETSLKFQFTE
jgi:hypothetical protein